MPRIVPLLALALVAFSCAALAPRHAVAAARSCEAIKQDMVSIKKNGQVDGLPDLFAQAKDTARSGCGEKTIFCLGRVAAYAYVAKAYEASDAHRSPQEIIDTLLSAAKEFGKPWALWGAIGDIEFDLAAKGRGDLYLQAAAHLEAELNDLNEDNLNACPNFDEPGYPDPKEIKHVVARATEAKLLASSFQVSRTREGLCGGVFLTEIRGFAPKSTPLPIEFDFDSTNFTGKGRQAAQALLDCASQEKFSGLRLTGHTDRTGSDAYNFDLSARRLEAVKEYLMSGGYHGRIELIPKGSREPFEVDDPTQHSQSEIDQLNRRVELSGAAK